MYEQLQENLSSVHPDFPIRANDHIFDELFIDSEDFNEDIVEEIAQRTGRTLDGVESNPYYGKVNTVAELVYYFNLQPKQVAA